MSEEINAYEAEVRRIAEILAKSYYGYAHDTSPPDVQEQDVDGHMREARAMVAEMAKAHYKGFITGMSAKDQFPLDDEKSIDSRNKYYKSILIERGLIPSPENATGSDTPE